MNIGIVLENPGFRLQYFDVIHYLFILLYEMFILVELLEILGHFCYDDH